MKKDELKVTALEITDKVFPPAVKIDLFVEAVKKVESMIEQKKEEIKKIQAEISEYQKQLDMVDAILKKGSMKSYQGYNAKITVAMSKGSGVTIIDEKAIPGKYKKIIQETRIDKKAILKDYKETGEVPAGVELKSSQWVLYTLKSPQGSGETIPHGGEVINEQ